MDVREKLEVIAHLGEHITYKEDIGICYDSALAKVIEDAYMELKNGVTVQEWISVKDRLPGKNTDVLIYNIEEYIGSDFLTKDGKWFWSEELPPTHWMPLPEPPKGE